MGWNNRWSKSNQFTDFPNHKWLYYCGTSIEIICCLCIYANKPLKRWKLPMPRQSVASINSFFLVIFPLLFVISSNFSNYSNFSLMNPYKLSSCKVIKQLKLFEKYITTTLILFKLKLNYWDVSLVHIQK